MEFPEWLHLVSLLLTTPNEPIPSWPDMQTYQKEEGDEAGPFAFHAAGWKPWRTHRAMWFGLPHVSAFNDQYNQQVSGANQVFSSNCMGGPVKRRRESPFMPRP